MREKTWNFFGPTVVGYRLETYRRLPVGWSAAPKDIPTDLAMWRKFLALPHIVVGSRHVITSLHFPNALRRDWPDERRLAEISRHANLMASPWYLHRVTGRILLGRARHLVGRAVRGTMKLA